MARETCAVPPAEAVSWEGGLEAVAGYLRLALLESACPRPATVQRRSKGRETGAVIQGACRVVGVPLPGSTPGSVPQDT